MVRTPLILNLLTFFFVVGFSIPIFAQHPLPVNDSDWAESNQAVFLNGEVMIVNVTMAESDLDRFLANPYLDTYVDCTVNFVNSVIDETLLNVAIRPRGNSQRSSKKFPWKLSFNEFVPGRKFHGVEKMNLASESQDPSMARETLAYEIFRAAGVASGRTNHIWLTINDGTKVQGVFNNIEQVDEEFVQAWFGNKDGDLYKCRWKEEGAKLLWISPGDAATYEALRDYEEKITGSYQRLAEFIDFVCNTDDITFKSGIGNWINVDSFLRAQAVDMYLGQWDGLWIFPNNYYLYWDTESQKFEYIPWDLDHCMGMDYFWIPYIWGTDWARRPFANWGLNSAASLSGENGPPLINRLLSIPEYESLILGYVREFASNQGHPEKLLLSVYRIFSLLSPIAYTGTFSGSSMQNGYEPQDFVDSWEFPSDYSATTNPATWGILPFLRERSRYVRDNYPLPDTLPTVSVNEVVSKNETGIVDEAGEQEDWVELYNSSNQAVDIGGFFLTDRYSDARKWQIPLSTVIPPNGFQLIWCDNEISEGPLHANFKLTSSGEGVYLFAPNPDLDILISSLLFPQIDADNSWGRLPDGGLNCLELIEPSPQSPNQSGDFQIMREGLNPDGQVVHAVGATPNRVLAFAYSPNLGSYVISGGNPCLGLTLGLGPPVQVGAIRRADENGSASVSIPPGYAPSGLIIQCLDVDSCSLSNLLEL